MQIGDSFVTVLFDGPNDYLLIPHDYAIRRFGNVAPEDPILLIFTTGRYWYVRIEKFGDHFYITQGWSEVVQQIPLQRNYYVEFEFYDGTTLFMDVSDATGRSILAMPMPINAIYPANVNGGQDDEPLSFQQVVTVRRHFRLPSRLSELGGFNNGMTIRIAYENEKSRPYKLRCQSNMPRYQRFIIRGWKHFARRYGLEIGQLITLTYDFQSGILFVDEVD